MQKNSLGVPIAIVIAAIIIAGAIYFGGGSPNTSTPGTGGGEGTNAPGENAGVTIEPVTEEDHIRGNPNAPVMLVEYSDYDCAFCRIFHDTMVRVMAEYGASGQVAWVHRHFPIASLHPDAPHIAEASECVAELGGNDAFWTFTDQINDSREVTYAADGSISGVAPTDVTRLPEFAEAAGVDRSALQECLDSGRYESEIQEDFNAAIAAGAEGTPYTVIIVGSEQAGIINGAQPYDAVKRNLDAILEQIN